MYVYVKAEDGNKKTVFLAKMVTNNTWEIPSSEWSGWIDSTSNFDNIIKIWHPKIGDIVVDLSSPIIKIRKTNESNLDNLISITDKGYCIPYIGQSLDEYLY